MDAWVEIARRDLLVVGMYRPSGWEVDAVVANDQVTIYMIELANPHNVEKFTVPIGHGDWHVAYSYGWPSHVVVWDRGGRCP